MGKLGIPVWCYEWMTDFNWLRTNIEHAVARRLGGDQLRRTRCPRTHRRPSTARSARTSSGATSNTSCRRWCRWPRKRNVKLAMHPDDPPLSPIRGVGRIMRSVENYQRLLDLVPSPMNGITLCQGNFTLMTDDLPARHPPLRRQEDLLRPFPRREGHAEKFEETWHDAGKTDMLACMRAYREIGFEGVLRPDHVPTVEGDSNERRRVLVVRPALRDRLSSAACARRCTPNQCHPEARRERPRDLARRTSLDERRSVRRDPSLRSG